MKISTVTNLLGATPGVGSFIGAGRIGAELNHVYSKCEGSPNHSVKFSDFVKAADRETAKEITQGICEFIPIIGPAIFWTTLLASKIGKAILNKINTNNSGNDVQGNISNDKIHYDNYDNMENHDIKPGQQNIIHVGTKVTIFGNICPEDGYKLKEHQIQGVVKSLKRLDSLDSNERSVINKNYPSHSDSTNYYSVNLFTQDTLLITLLNRKGEEEDYVIHFSNSTRDGEQKIYFITDDIFK